MLGLLGTVTGMVDAFMGLGTAIGPEKASILAIAISQALYTTAAGLLVAIPAIVFSVMFRNILERRIELVSDVLDDLLKYIPQPEQMPVPEGNLRKRSGR
jgi:biopolymer transport protein ExbB